MTVYKVKDENGFTRYSTELLNLALHKDFIKTRTLQRERKNQ
jgi:hypothetical protein